MRRLRAALVGGLLLAPSVAVLAGPATAARADDSPSSINCPNADGSAASTAQDGSGNCTTTVTSLGTTTVGASIACTQFLGFPQCDGSAPTLQVLFGGKVVASAGFSGTGDGSRASAVVPGGSPNGTYTARIVASDGQTVYRSAAVHLLAAPSAPSGVKASTPSGTFDTVTLAWGASSPGDVDGYVLSDGGTAFKTVTPSAACSGSGCSVTLTGVDAGSHTYAVAAQRPNGSGQEIASPPAKASAVVVSDPPSADPSTSPTATPTTGDGTTTGGGDTGSGTVTAGGGTAAGGSSGTGTTGATGSTGSTGSSSSIASSAAAAAAAATAAAAAAQHRAASFQSFAPPAGIAQLPPLPSFPSATSAASGDGEPTDPGTYVPTLPYNGQQTVTEKVTKPTLLGHVTDSIGDRGVLESLAGAALVLLVAAHLRVFARRDPLRDL